MKELRCSSLFLDEAGSIAYKRIMEYTYPWEVLPFIKSIILEIAKSLDAADYEKIGDDVWIARSAKVAPTASIYGPSIIMDEAEIRQCAFIRGSALVGRGAVVGNSCELKNCILFDKVQVPHFNYVGDSILGYRSHMGAGAVTSNVKSDKTLISVYADGNKIETRLKKFGAILGDYVEVGCNSVLNPGTVIGAHSNVYPLSPVRGFVPENSIFKSQNNIVLKR